MVDLQALLIGIQDYEPNDYCSGLEGPVADVEAMAEFLVENGLPRERIRKLISRHADEARVGEECPTYENMVAAIKMLTREARRGEQVLLYYSGHGGRTHTLIPGAKGQDGVDEGFVPPNVGDPDARYLRDVELSYLVREMVGKGLVVTVILDACHSGGMTRGAGGLVPRGRRDVDPTERPLDSLVASREELEASWTRAHGRAYRSRGKFRPSSESGWMPATEGVVVLSACRSFESAYEGRFDDECRGLLTYSLLEVLGGGGWDLSFRRIHDRLIGRVQRRCSHQTPVVEGDVSRNLFGDRLHDLLSGVRVLEVDAPEKRVLVDIGLAIGVGRGARLRVVAESGESEGPHVEIRDSGAVSSWAVACGDEPSFAAIQPGDRAIVVDPGETFRRRVVLVPPGSGGGAHDGPPELPWWRRALTGFGEAPPAVDRGAACEALAEVRRAISEHASGFLELGDGDGEPAFQVTVNAEEAYEIWHADGGQVADLPPLLVTEPRAAEKTVERLVHLCKFQNVRDLENRVPGVPLREALEVSLRLLPEDFELGDPIEPLELEDCGPVPKITSGRWICLEIANRSLQQLEIYVLDLQPGWGVELAHPLSGLETLEGENKLLLPFEAYLPSRFEDPRETLKVFATSDPADFRWLELPPIDHLPRNARGSLGDPGDPLEQLFAEIAKDGPRARHVWTHHVSRHWTSAQVRFEVER